MLFSCNINGWNIIDSNRYWSGHRDRGLSIPLWGRYSFVGKLLRRTREPVGLLLWQSQRFVPCCSIQITYSFSPRSCFCGRKILAEKLRPVLALSWLPLFPSTSRDITINTRAGLRNYLAYQVTLFVSGPGLSGECLSCESLADKTIDRESTTSALGTKVYGGNCASDGVPGHAFLLHFSSQSSYPTSTPPSSHPVTS